jgi:Domain of unknown function (DUF5916)
MPIIAILALAQLAAVTSAVARPPRLRAVRVKTPPILDGKLDDPAWALAPPSGAFTQKIPNDGAFPSDPTTVRVLYDDDSVYVGFDCPQTHTPVVEWLTRRDRIVEVDSVTVDLGPRGDHKSAFQFYVNASGTLADGIRYNDTEYSPDWDENWEARTSVDAHGWTAELRIPLRVLRLSSLPVRSWDFQASRYISRRQETDVWAYFPRSVGGEVSHYGRLDGTERARAARPVEARPFIVGRLRRRDRTDPTLGQLASGTDVVGSAGLDLGWHPTPDLTLDATFNPDFAQVEADQVVLNLSNVATYYPEKRPFFLDGIDAFTTPFQLLYSRRIGAAPPIPSLRTDDVNRELLVDAPEASTIYGATKLTWRVANTWSVGTLQAVTAPNSVQVQLGDGSRVTRTVSPLSAFTVVRVKHDMGENAEVGVTTTSVTHAERTTNYPSVAASPGDAGGAGETGATTLCPTPLQLTPFVQIPLQVRPSGVCFNDAYVGAIDWRWRAPGGDYVTGGQFASSILGKGPPRPVADGTVERPGDVGWAVQAYIAREGGRHWVGSLRADIESARFEINDLGYDARANLVSGSANVEYRELAPWGPFLENHEAVFARPTFSQTGLALGTALNVASFGRFKNRWEYWLDAHHLTTRFDDREVGDGTALERPSSTGTEMFIATDATRRLALDVDQVTELVAAGFNMAGSAGLHVRVLPQFDFDLLPTWQWSRGETRFATQGAAPGDHLFGQLEAKSVGLTIRTTYTFAPRLTLQGYAQVFLASRHFSHFAGYTADPGGSPARVRLADLSPFAGALPANPDSEQGVLDVNLVLRWEFALGSIVYLVYTRSQLPTTVLGANDVGTLDLGAVRRAPASDAVLVKVSYWYL